MAEFIRIHFYNMFGKSKVYTLRGIDLDLDIDIARVIPKPNLNHDKLLAFYHPVSETPKKALIWIGKKAKEVSSNTPTILI